MQRRSHNQLAHTLLAESNGFAARRYEWAFLIGAVEPDCNPLSYLKGSIHGHTLQGHHFSNSHQYIDQHIRRLQNRKTWNIWQYYTLGKLTHYVADAYTYPHNEHFPDSLMAHRRYEEELRLWLRDFLEAQSDSSSNDRKIPNVPTANLSKKLQDLHDQYMAGDAGLRQDCRYILTATRLLMRDCPPSPASYRLRRTAQRIRFQGARAAHALNAVLLAIFLPHGFL